MAARNKVLIGPLFGLGGVMSRRVATKFNVVVIAALLSLGGSAVAQERVGVNSAVNQQATGTPPGAGARPLVIGQDVVFNERIATAAVGQTQLLFLDESSMSIGQCRSDHRPVRLRPADRQRQAGDDHDPWPVALCRRQAVEAG